MPRKSTIEKKAVSRLEQLKKERSKITMLTQEYLNQVDVIDSNIILLEELLTAPD